MERMGQKGAERDCQAMEGTEATANPVFTHLLLRWAHFPSLLCFLQKQNFVMAAYNSTMWTNHNVVKQYLLF